MVDYYGGHPAIPAKEKVQTGAAAVSDLLVAHASRARWLAEFTYGAAISGVEPSCPTPAHSTQPGHDHSGGGSGGTPIVRPLWSCSMGYDATLFAAGGWGGNGGAAPSGYLTTGSVYGERAYVLNNTALKSVFIPGCAKDGCYFTGQVVLSVYASAAVTLYVEIGGVRSTQALSAAAHADWAITNQVSLRPGTYNRIPLVAWIQGTVAANVIVSVEGISINQIATTP